MESLLKWGLKNRVVVMLLALLALLAGVLAAYGIRMEKYPDVEMPTLVLVVKYPNHTAEEVERSLTLPVEKAIGNVTPYESLTSQSRENGALITVSYEFGADMDQLEDSIHSAVAQTGLPSGAEVTYKRISADAKPVYKLALASDSLDELESSIETGLLPGIRAVKGVSSAELAGAADNQLDIIVNQTKAGAYGITLTDIRTALQQADYILPLGTMDEQNGRIAVGLEGQVESLETLSQLPVPVKRQLSPGGPATVRLGELAELKESEHADMLTRYNGEPAVVLEVYKSQDSNTVEVVDAVKKQIDSFRPSVAYNAHTMVDQGQDVQESVNSMLREGGFGALFTVLVILVFLRNLRATLIAVLALPLSILGTIFVLKNLGYSLNIMTLGGIAVAVGRIVDDSIVVIENIFRWLRKEPDKRPMEAVFHATREVFGAVTSSTVATVVIFLPLAFVDGIVGEFFRPFSMAVVTSILISLVVAFLLIPAIATYMFKRMPHERESGRLTGGYQSLLSWSLGHKWAVIALAFLLLAGSGVMARFIPKTFLPSESANGLRVVMELPEGTSRDKTDALSVRVEEKLQAEEQVDSVQASIGQSSEVKLVNTNAPGDHKAIYDVLLKNGADLAVERPRLEGIVEEVMKPEYPQGTVRLSEIQTDGPPSGDSIEVTLYGNDAEALRQASGQVEKMLAANSRMKNVSGSAQQLQTKYTVVLKDEAKLQGVMPLAVYQQANERLQPQQAGVLQLDGKDWKLALQYDGALSGKSELLQMKVQTAQGLRALGEIADVKDTTAPLSIQHQDGKSAVVVTADSSGQDVGKATESVKKDMAGLSLPQGVSWEVGGGQKMMADGFRDLGTAMALAVGLVFIVLSVTFGGMLTPLVILSSLIFVPFGSLGALLVTGEALSMSGMIGMLMLIGIVVTNAVVLLERIETNRHGGMALGEAVSEACAVRLRPILMTALATVFALLPLALSHSGSGVISKGLAISVIGGLFASTMLTLVFIPVLYSMAGKWRDFTRV